MKNIVKSANFTYFIRYFSVFTVIFITMTIIIMQIMRTNIYRSTDRVLQYMAKEPKNILYLAKARTIGMNLRIEDPDEKVKSDDTNSEKRPMGIRIDNNTTAVLFDVDGNIISSGDPFLGLDQFKLNESELGKIFEKPFDNYYGDTEYYRYIPVKMDDVTTQEENVKYAVILTNTSQLRATSTENEKIIIVVMISFWLVSIFAAMALASLTVKPILTAYEKQKSFVENASHELRTPLTVLQNRLENLFRKPNATILEASESIASSLDEVRNMRLLTTNLLNLARRDDGIKPEIITVDATFFDTIIENYELIAEDSEKTLVAQNLVKRSIKTDKVLLKQLINILFDNAVKYTEPNGNIALNVRTTDRQFIILVADDGPGISDSDKKKIFDRFYRVDKARTRQKGGFGLGLSLAKQIVDNLKGTITVKDNSPKGTIFEVRFNR